MEGIGHASMAHRQRLPPQRRTEDPRRPREAHEREKYTDVSSCTAAYLTWPDARLRTYLHEHGVSDAKLPTSRPGLPQEVRNRWVQTSGRASAVWHRVKGIFDSGVAVGEDKLGQILDILTGSAEGAKEGAKEGAYAGNEKQWKDKRTFYTQQMYRVTRSGLQSSERKERRVERSARWRPFELDADLGVAHLGVTRRRRRPSTFREVVVRVVLIRDRVGLHLRAYQSGSACTRARSGEGGRTYLDVHAVAELGLVPDRAVRGQPGADPDRVRARRRVRDAEAVAGAARAGRPPRVSLSHFVDSEGTGMPRTRAQVPGSRSSSVGGRPGKPRSAEGDGSQQIGTKEEAREGGAYRREDGCGNIEDHAHDRVQVEHDEHSGQEVGQEAARRAHQHICVAQRGNRAYAMMK